MNYSLSRFSRCLAVGVFVFLFVPALPTLAGLPLLGPVPQFIVPVSASAPTLDGRLDEPCWEQALSSGAFYPLGVDVDPERPGSETTLYLARYGRTLLVGLDCRTVPDQSGIESVLVLLDTTHTHELSHYITIYGDGTSKQQAWWDPSWATLPAHYEAAVARDEGGWSAELAIDLTRLPYARSHHEDIGCFVARQFEDSSRLLWALPNAHTSFLTESWDPYLARHLTGLDLPAMFAEMDEENDVTFAPLAARAEKLDQQVGALLADEQLPPEVRLRAASLAAYAEEANPRERECVERISVRGLDEREVYLRDAEALAAVLRGRPTEESGSDLAALFSGPRNPAYWELNGTRLHGRWRNWNYGLGLMLYGIPLATAQERFVRPPLNVEQRCANSDEYLRERGSMVAHEARGRYDVCVETTATGVRRIAYARSGEVVYRAEAAVPGGDDLVMEALVARRPFDGALAARLWSRFPAPVRIEDAAGLLSFPLSEATVVLPAEMDRAQGAQLRAQLLTLGQAQGVAAAPPPTGPAVILGTAKHEQALQAAGFDPRSWGAREAQGYVALRADGGRALVGIWGRDGEGLARAVRVLLDLRRVLSDRELLIGDLHLHSMLSDGSGSPRQVLLGCMAAGMDFAAITDHSFGGASYQGKAWSDQWVPSFTAIRGAEVQGADFEMLALGISHDVEAQPDPQQIAADIHAQGGTALLCHPYGPPYMEIVASLEALGLDGIDRYTGPIADYVAERQLIGRQPVVTSVTDAHDLSFVRPHRTLVFAADRSEKEILSAVREGHSVALNTSGLSGAPHLVDMMLALIGERQYLRARYEANVQARVEDLARAWDQGGL
ncbi:MAG TPA: hypothetical protein VMY87_07320 [Armatimonadota bacterium]|nr:hypothetical protein [Armatimonadota bacterium]